MILERIEYLTTDCPRPARRLGYLKAAVAIHARRRRLGPAWDDHLERRREAFDKNGGRLTDQDALFGVSLPEGGAEWSWTLAPPGEVNKDYGIRDRVVGYCEFTPLRS